MWIRIRCARFPFIRETTGDGSSENCSDPKLQGDTVNHIKRGILVGIIVGVAIVAIIEVILGLIAGAILGLVAGIAGGVVGFFFGLFFLIISPLRKG
jgi:hypothetical protein